MKKIISKITPLVNTDITRVFKGFTLAEVLITLTILGIIAAITVPSLISKQRESANRVKLRKAMAAYDSAINKMSIISGFRTQQAFEDWAQGNGCENARSFFKVVESTIADEGCSFRTSDGLWWNISEIDRTLIAFKQADLDEDKAKDPDDKDAFVLVTSFDSSNETLRIDDLGYEKGLGSSNATIAGYVEKLYNFMNNKKTNDTPINPFVSCSEFPCEVNGLSWKGKIQISQTEADEVKSIDRDLCSWDPEKNECTLTGGSEVKVIDEDLFISAPLTLTEDEAKSAKNCATSRDPSSCATNGDYWNLARRKCLAAGGRLPTIAELEAMYNKEELSSDIYWASEASSSNTNSSLALDGGYASNPVEDSSTKAICLGN